MTDAFAHVLLLLFPAALIAFHRDCVPDRTGEVRRQRQAAETHATTLEDSIRADTVSMIIDRTSHGGD